MDEHRRLSSRQEREIEALQAQCEARLAAARRAAASTPHLVQLRKLYYALNKQRRHMEALEVRQALESLERREAEGTVGAVEEQNEEELEALLRRHARERQALEARMQRELLEAHALRVQPSALEASELASAWGSPSLRHPQPPPPVHSHRKLRAGASPYLSPPVPPSVRRSPGPARGRPGRAGRVGWRWEAGVLEDGERMGQTRHAMGSFGPQSLGDRCSPSAAGSLVDYGQQQVPEHMLGYDECQASWGVYPKQGSMPDQEAPCGCYYGMEQSSEWSDSYGGSCGGDGWDAGAPQQSGSAWRAEPTRPYTAASTCSAPAAALAACTTQLWGSTDASWGSRQQVQLRSPSPGPPPGMPPPTPAQANSPLFDAADWEVFCTLQQAAQQWYEGLPLHSTRTAAQPSSGPALVQPWAQQKGVPPPPGRRPGRHPESPLARRLAQLKGIPLADIWRAGLRDRAYSAPPSTGRGLVAPTLSGSSTPLSDGSSLEHLPPPPPPPLPPQQQLPQQRLQHHQHRPRSCGLAGSRGGPSPILTPRPCCSPGDSVATTQPPPAMHEWDQRQDLLPQLLSLLLSGRTSCGPVAPQAACEGPAPARQQHQDQQQQQSVRGALAATLPSAPVGAQPSVPPGACHVVAAAGQQQVGAAAEQPQPVGTMWQPATLAASCSGGEAVATGGKESGASLSAAPIMPNQRSPLRCPSPAEAQMSHWPQHAPAAPAPWPMAAVEALTAAAQPQQVSIKPVQPSQAPHRPEGVAAAAAGAAHQALAAGEAPAVVPQPQQAGATACQPSAAMGTPAIVQPAQAAAYQPTAAPAELQQAPGAAAVACLPAAAAASAPLVPTAANAQQEVVATLWKLAAAGHARQGPAQAAAAEHAAAAEDESEQAGPQRPSAAGQGEGHLLGGAVCGSGVTEAAAASEAVGLEAGGGGSNATAAATAQDAIAAELHEHCRQGRYDEARQLLKEASLPVDVRDPQGNTPLMLACAGGHGRIVKLCLRKGAAIDAQDAAGNTALLLAAASGHRAVAKHLLEMGASPSVRNAQGVSAGELIVKWSGQVGAGLGK